MRAGRVTATFGTPSGARLCKALRPLRHRYSGARIIIAIDVDRYGSPERVLDAVSGPLRGCCSSGCRGLVHLVPVVEKLEDWVYTLLAARPCRCCGRDKLSSLLGEEIQEVHDGEGCPGPYPQKN